LYFAGLGHHAGAIGVGQDRQAMKTGDELT
jgi:hypothetical protein